MAFILILQPEDRIAGNNEITIVYFGLFARYRYCVISPLDEGAIRAFIIANKDMRGVEIDKKVLARGQVFTRVHFEIDIFAGSAPADAIRACFLQFKVFVPIIPFYYNKTACDGSSSSL